MPRSRTRDFDLPPRCSRRNGRISYRPPSGGRITFDLPRNATVKQIWDEYDLIVRSHRPHSLRTIAETYFDSVIYEKYAPRTMKDHRNHLKSLEKVFGDSDMSRAQPAHITAWRNKRGKVAKESANKELSFLRVIMDHAVEVGLLQSSPAKLVKKLPLTKAEQDARRIHRRNSYVTDAQYHEMHKQAGTTLQAAMEILYCTGIRMGDLLRLKWSDVHEDYIEIVEGKTINEYRKEISPRLSAALQKARKIKPLSPYVIHTGRGRKYTEDGFGTLWQYTRTHKMPEHLRFGIHRIRHKAITDADDKRKFSQHKTQAMADHYDDSIPTSPSH
jgi:integrase